MVDSVALVDESTDKKTSYIDIAHIKDGEVVDTAREVKMPLRESMAAPREYLLKKCRENFDIGQDEEVNIDEDRGMEIVDPVPPEENPFVVTNKKEKMKRFKRKIENE